jgi:phospholipase/carboxylesterase
MIKLTRRAFVGAASALGACAQRSNGNRENRLSARPGSPDAPVAAGLRKLEVRSERDALLYIPESAKKFKSAPLVVSLHGAGRTADRGIELLRTLSDQHGFLLLAPASAETTWDLEGDPRHPDVAGVNRALERTFAATAVDPKRIAMSGFSDGASYSLTLGLANGDLFAALFGFSPGFIGPAERVGKPPVFISHGIQDQVLPIEACSRRIVPRLKAEGYPVTYREFEGRHTLPPEIAADALRWFMESTAAA